MANRAGAHLPWYGLPWHRPPGQVSRTVPGCVGTFFFNTDKV